MRTNKEKYDHFYRMITDAEREFINGEMPNPPKKLFSLVPIGRIDTWEVEGTGYSNKLYSTEKPKRTDVAEAKEYYENIPEMDKDNIMIMLVCHREKSRTMSTIKLNEIGKRYYLDFNEAEKALNELTLKKEKDKELLSNGHIRCAYCGKIVKESDSIEFEIIFRSRNVFGPCVGRKTNRYCPGGCAGYDQMAHEG